MMLELILNNISNIIICAVLIAVVIMIAASMIKNKKQGKSLCGCGCKNCAMKNSCHGKR